MARITIDVPGFDPTMPALKLEELHIEESKLANGYDCEFVIMGVRVSNIRVNAITIGTLLLAFQEAQRSAWALKKQDAVTTDFEMQLERGANKPN